MTSTIHSEIIETNEADHTVVARFWTDRIGPDMLDPQRDTETGEILLRADGSPVRIRTDTCIGLPADMVLDPEAQEFRDFIVQFAPAAWFEVLEAKLDGQVDPVTPMLGASSSFQAQATRELQLRLDAWARTRGYDHCLSLCTYATSPNPQFAAEGLRGVQERDRTWTSGYEIISDVETGVRPVPTLAELLAEIPAPSWAD